MKLKVTHIPLYNAWGLLEDIERSEIEAKNRSVIKYYDIVLNTIIDLEIIKIKIILINDKNCSFKVIKNNGDRFSDTLDNESVIKLDFGKHTMCYLNITDCIESWDIELMKTKE